MNLETIKSHLEAYKSHNQIEDAASFIIRTAQLEDENFAGFGFREEFSPTSILLTAEGVLGGPQKIMIPKNLFDFDITLVLNVLAHEMLHVKQKKAGQVVEDKNEREFQAYTEMLYHKVFPQIPDAPDFSRKQFCEKALEYYRRMGEGSELQKRYKEEKEQVEKTLNEILIKRGEN